MRKGYFIEKLHYLGGMLPGMIWKVTAPSKHEYRIKRYDNGDRNYSYILEYSDGNVAPSMIFGPDDGLVSRNEAIKIIYALEDHGQFEGITDMIHFSEGVINA